VAATATTASTWIKKTALQTTKLQKNDLFPYWLSLLIYSQT
jgi:hypothetical protein